ncbi:MAG TPA: hypothetical protein VGS03_10965 [Candidatus Polarisedimenticolia bacterium]|jgi:hypothetical protein|nr:hypothetical protein [Candidatus Polarisedimenticolia bacterium]
MKRRWPYSIWLGLAVVLAAPVLYLTVLVPNPATRAMPWPSLLLFAVGVALLLHGLLRAWRAPQVYRGKVVAAIALASGLAVTGFFCWGLFYAARQVPDSLGAPRVGQLAPDFTLPDQDGRPVSLAQLLASPHASNGAMLVFYRGGW